MKRLYIFCEGLTEREFVASVLTEHLTTIASEPLLIRPIVVGAGRNRRGRGSEPLGKGDGFWKSWRADIELCCTQQKGSSVRFSTLFDLYGLPRDFPKLPTPIADPVERANALQTEVDGQIGDWRFLAYIQVHEFEALVLASLDALEAIRDEADAEGIDALRTLVADTPPEAVNDGVETAPSKRIIKAIPSYSKVDDGPWAIEETGLAAIREACPRFGEWLGRLEAWVTER